MPEVDLTGAQIPQLVALPGGTEIATTVPAPARERVERLERIWAERPGVLGWLTTTDHKRIGLLYFWATLVFFAAGGIEALLMRTQLAVPNNHVLGPSTYDQLFTMHGLTMIFWFIIPMTTGAFGNYLIPLMIGARDMAFPRLNALSFWIFAARDLRLRGLPRRIRRRTRAGSTTCRSRRGCTTPVATSSSTPRAALQLASRRRSRRRTSSSRSSSSARRGCRSTASRSSASRSSPRRSGCSSRCRRSAPI